MSRIQIPAGLLFFLTLSLPLILYNLLQLYFQLVGISYQYVKAKRLEVTHITKKGQVVIPKAIRERLHLEEGTPLGVEVTDTGIIVMKEIEVSFEKDDLKAIDTFWDDVESKKLEPVPVNKFLEDIETW